MRLLPAVLTITVLGGRVVYGAPSERKQLLQDAATVIIPCRTPRTSRSVALVIYVAVIVPAWQQGLGELGMESEPGGLVSGELVSPQQINTWPRKAETGSRKSARDRPSLFGCFLLCR
jgi:hypothetical protein